MFILIYYPPPNDFTLIKSVASLAGQYTREYALTIHLNRFIKPDCDMQSGFFARNFLYSVGCRAPPVLLYAYPYLISEKEVRCMDGS